MKKLSLLAAILLIYISPETNACSPIPIETCAGAKLFKLDRQSSQVLSDKLAEFDALLDLYISKVKPDPSEPINSCFNQHFSSMYLREIIFSSENNQGRTCRAHINHVLKTKPKEDSEEMKYAFRGDIPADMKRLFDEVQTAYFEFSRHHRNSEKK